MRKTKRACAALPPPVRDHSGGPVAAISVSGPTFRVSKEKVPELAESVMRAAAALSRELGQRVDESVPSKSLAS